MLRAHCQAWAWQDEWVGLTMEDIRRLERETQIELRRKLGRPVYSDEEENGENGGGYDMGGEGVRHWPLMYVHKYSDVFHTYPPCPPHTFPRPILPTPSPILSSPHPLPLCPPQTLPHSVLPTSFPTLSSPHPPPPCPPPHPSHPVLPTPSLTLFPQRMMKLPNTK